MLAERFGPNGSGQKVGVGQKEALAGRKAIDQLPRPGPRGLLKGVVGDGEAPEVGRVFAQRQPAVEVQGVERREGVEQGDEPGGAGLELGGIRGVHRLRRLPVWSYWRPWPSKPWVISWPMMAPRLP